MRGETLHDNGAEDKGNGEATPDSPTGMGRLALFVLVASPFLLFGAFLALDRLIR